MRTSRANRLISKFKEKYSREYGIPFKTSPYLFNSEDGVCLASSETVQDSRLNPIEVIIGYNPEMFAGKNVDNVELCSILVAIGHEKRHFEQVKELKSGEASLDMQHSWLSSLVSKHYSDVNYSLMYHEIDAEQSGFQFASDVLEKVFHDKTVVNDLLKQYVKSGNYFISKSDGSYSLEPHMLEEKAAQFKEISDWDKLFDELKIESRAINRKYEPQIFDGHKVDDLERFYKQSDSNRQFIERALKSGESDRMVCIAGMRVNDGYFAIHSNWYTDAYKVQRGIREDIWDYVGWDKSESIASLFEQREQVDKSLVMDDFSEQETQLE